MSRLLIDEHPLQVLPSLAEAIGLNEAIVLQQLHYWLKDSKKIYDGKPWTYNSVAEWQKQFPFWSESTIRRTINNLRKLDLVEVTSKYNKMPMDKTLWYTVRYDVLNRVTIPFSQNDHMVRSDCTHGLVKMDKAIPKTITKTITKTKSINNNVQPSDDSVNDRFETLYKTYPKKQGKKRALAAYKKAVKAGVTDEQIADGIKRYCFLLETKRTETKYIKQAGTWFFNEGWNDEYETDRRYRGHSGNDRAGEKESGGIIGQLARKRAANGQAANDGIGSDVGDLEWFD